MSYNWEISEAMDQLTESFQETINELEEERELLLAIKAACEEGGFPKTAGLLKALLSHDKWVREKASQNCPGCFPGKPCYQHKKKS